MSALPLIHLPFTGFVLTSLILCNRYIGSRIFLHDPPGENNALQVHPDAPEAIKREEWRLANEDPEVNPWMCIGMLAVAVGIMAATAEMVSRTSTSSLTREC